MGSRSAMIAAHVVVITINLNQLNLLREDGLIERVQAACCVNPRLRIIVVMTGTEQPPVHAKLAIVQNLVKKLGSAELFACVMETDRALHDAHQHGLSIVEYQPANQENMSGMRHLFDTVFAAH